MRLVVLKEDLKFTNLLYSFKILNEHCRDLSKDYFSTNKISNGDVTPKGIKRLR